MEVVPYESKAIEYGKLDTGIVIQPFGELSHVIFNDIRRDEDVVVNSIVERSDLPHCILDVDNDPRLSFIS